MIAAWPSFLALRYLLTRRINLLSLFGVLFAVWATLVVDAVFSGFVFEIRSDVRRATPDLLVTDLPAGSDFEPIRAAIAAAAGDDVAAIAPRLRHQGLVQPLRSPRFAGRAAMASELDFDSMEGGFALLLGVDPELEPAVVDLPAWLHRGDASLAARGVTAETSPVLLEPAAERRREWLLPDDVEWRARERNRLPAPERVADHRSQWPGVLLGWRRYGYQRHVRLGDPMELLTAVQGDDGTIQPRQARLAFAGYFSTGYKLVDATTVLLPIERLRTLLGHDLADPDSVALVTDVAVRWRAGLSPAAAAQRTAQIQAAVQAALGASAAPCTTLDWEQQSQVYLTAIAHEHRMMQVVLFVVMLVAVFVIYATLRMMVVQKWKDVGIAAAIGGSPQQIGQVFLLCGAVVGSLGALLGATAGLVTAFHLNDLNDWLYAQFQLELFPRALFDLPRIPVHVDPDWVVLVAVGALLLALLVSWLPARAAARMNPVQAISYE